MANRSKRRFVYFLAFVICTSMFIWPGLTKASETDTVFKGYFKNVDYSNPDAFVNVGEQTKINKEIQDIANGFNNNKDISTVEEIYQWMSKNLKYGEGEKFGRTSAEIINSRMDTGCTDMGLAFIALARAKGIPSVFVQTGRIDWISELVENDPDANYIIGHILVEVYLKDKWYLVDSTAGKLYLNYDKNNFSLPDGYYVFSKSIEVWDSGARNEQENASVMKDVFKNFDVKKYVNPKYDYIDLISGAQLKSNDFNGDSTVIGKMAVIAGEKEPAELFDSIFTRSFSGQAKGLMDVSLLGEKDATSTARLIILYSPESADRCPSYLKKMVPEITSTSSNFVMNTLRNGRRIILIKALRNNDLIRVIKGLPADFLDKDYRMEIKDNFSHINMGEIIRIDFSKSINPVSVNSNTVYIMDQGGRRISADIAAGSRFIFIQPKISDTTKIYKLVIKRGSGKNGLPISKDFVWSFKVDESQLYQTKLVVK